MSENMPELAKQQTQTQMQAEGVRESDEKENEKESWIVTVCSTTVGGIIETVWQKKCKTSSQIKIVTHFSIYTVMKMCTPIWHHTLCCIYFSFSRGQFKTVISCVQETLYSIIVETAMILLFKNEQMLWGHKKELTFPSFILCNLADVQWNPFSIHTGSHTVMHYQRIIKSLEPQMNFFSQYKHKTNSFQLNIISLTRQLPYKVLNPIILCTVYYIILIIMCRQGP